MSSGRRCALILAIIFSTSIIPSALLTAGNVYAGECTVIESGVNIRSGPGTEYDVLGCVASGEGLMYEQAETDANGNIWYQVSYNGDTGYISADYVTENANDEVLETEPEGSGDTAPAEPESETESESETSPEEMTDEIASEDETSEETSAEEETSEEETDEETEVDAELFTVSQPGWSGAVQSEAEFQRQLAQFPESYRAGIRAVHAAYPNYTFTADYIDMDFQKLVDAQIGKKISAYYYSSWKAMYDDSFGWYENYNWDTGEWYNSEGMFTYASREVIEYYIDPRNFLDTSSIFMFMRQSYTPDQTVDDLRCILEGSFLANGYVPNSKEPNDVRLGGDYAKVIMEAAEKSGTSPFVLAASIILEHGYSGETPLISGYYKADDGTVYKNYFNFYDIGATGGDSNNVIQNGLEYAKREGWISRYLSIVNGAIWSADGYRANGQDTYYYREFNVINGWNELWHQFSTGILTAYCSTSLMEDALAGNKYASLNFRIPIYNNMPAETSPLPEYSDSLNNYYFTDMAGTGLEPEFSMAVREYSMSAAGDTTLSVAVPKWATYESPRYFSLVPGQNTVKLDVRSQTGYLRTYTITVWSDSYCGLSVDTYSGNHLDISDEPESGSVWGDANGDGKTSSLDYIMIKNHIMQVRVITDAARLKAADVNGDGKISALDYIAIKNYIMSN